MLRLALYVHVRYTQAMSTPAGAIAPYAGSPPPAPAVAAEPSAVTGPKSAAVFKLGQVLKTLIHNGRAFLSENDVDAAVSIVDRFVEAFVPGGEFAALLTGAERAAKEDVSQRVAPGMVPVGPAGITLDYEKLADAILKRQQQLQIGSGS